MFNDNALNEFYHTAEKMSQDQSIMKLKKESPEYQEWGKRRDELFQEIEDALSEEDKQLIFRFEEADCECDNLECDYTYRQGFQDCLMLLKWAGLFD